MIKKVAEHFADYLVEIGINYDFTVPGGGSMHLNDAFAHKEGMKCIYVQHEQAAAIAAESYARLNNQIPFVCCTTGPAGTNTLTGVLGAWLDSIPMLIISGQVKYVTTARYANIPVRAMGDQEFDIVKVVKSMTKYAEMITDKKMAMYHLEKAIFLAKSGRPGPSWIDVPLDIQWAMIDDSEFIHFDPIKEGYSCNNPISDKTLQEVIKIINKAKRPVFNAGNGIRIANAKNEFNEVINLLQIPVVTGWDSIDLIEDTNNLYCGRAGIMGDRPGNWAIQNSDVILSVGSRLGVRQVGYSKENWAREAFVIMVDIDEAELKKPSIHVELPICCDAKIFLKELGKMLKIKHISSHNEWNIICQNWKKNYPVVLPKHYNQKPEIGTNVYCFVKELSKRLSDGSITVVGNGSACVVGSHAYEIKKDARFIINSGAASMGYDLPAAIGAAFATNKEIICLSGDGSIQMNIQELQTIIHHKLPIKIFVINNQGYHSMRQTEANLFPEHTSFGIGPESHDLSFPNLKKIALAYGFPYFSIKDNDEVSKLDEILKIRGYVFVEIFVDKNQKFEPKSATKKLENGNLVSPPLEDLAPFLDYDELKKIMIIPMIKENNR